MPTDYLTWRVRFSCATRARGRFYQPVLVSTLTGDVKEHGPATSYKRSAEKHVRLANEHRAQHAKGTDDATV
jgi:hypothetical protein